LHKHYVNCNCNIFVWWYNCFWYYIRWCVNMTSFLQTVLPLNAPTSGPNIYSEISLSCFCHRAVARPFCTDTIWKSRSTVCTVKPWVLVSRAWLCPNYCGYRIILCLDIVTKNAMPFMNNEVNHHYNIFVDDVGGLKK